MHPPGPAPTVDILIEHEARLILIRRRNPPHGWAIPGGFVDLGESAENAARREAREETSLEVELVTLLGVYSDSTRDPRGHTISTVYVAHSRGGQPCAADDAAELGLFDETTLPEPLVFDHARILADYFHFKRTGALPKPAPPRR